MSWALGLTLCWGQPPAHPMRAVLTVHVNSGAGEALEGKGEGKPVLHGELRHRMDAHAHTAQGAPQLGGPVATGKTRVTCTRMPVWMETDCGNTALPKLVPQQTSHTCAQNSRKKRKENKPIDGLFRA